MEGNDLNHFVEGNQAGLFCSIIFEHITRPYPLPLPQTNIFYITNIKALALVVSDKVGPLRNVSPGRAHFVPQCHNLNTLGGQLGDVT